MFTRFPAFLALLLAFSLTACSDNDTVAEETMEEVAGAEVAPINPEPGVPADAPEVDVTGTIAALESGLTAIPAGDAVGNINGWIAKLEGAGFDGSEEITDNLEELRDALQAETLDGAAIGATLSRLGELTTAAAAGASSSSQEGLMRLGTLLSEGGAMLAGAGA